MKLVVTMGIRQLPSQPRPLQELYRDHLEESVLAEELGFDNVWASEHHFSPDAWNPSPITFLAAVAARTERVRIGTYVLLLPFHNPVRVAEDIAVLDNISGGRVDLPVGVGSAAEEFRSFGIPFNERLGRTFEALRIIERCFAGEEFGHKGKYYEFPNVRMTTTPAQRPGPPIWVASMGDQSVAWTARRGYDLAAGAGRGHAKYEELLAQYGHDRSKLQVASVPIRLHLAETREQAWDEASAGLHQVLHFYQTRVDLQSATSAAGVLDPLPPVREFRNVPGIGHRGTPFVVGTPDGVGRALAQYRDKRLTHLSLNFDQPGMDTTAVRRSMAIFAKELMPSVKDVVIWEGVSMVQAEGKPALGAGFTEGFVEADGFRIRYMEAGTGAALIHLHGAGGLRLTSGHDLLSRQFRVIAFEMPGFGQSPENTRTQNMSELAATMAEAVEKLGIDSFNLMGTSFGGKTALWLALEQRKRVLALVLEAPAAIRPEGAAPPSGAPEEMARRLYAHPERLPPMPPPDPVVQAKSRRLVARLRGPDRDADLERRLKDLATPTLVLFGTVDRVISPDMGHLYKELIPNCYLVFVYDAGHAISTDRPEAFTEVVVDFLERHEAFVISRTPTVIHP